MHTLSNDGYGRWETVSVIAEITGDVLRLQIFLLWLQTFPACRLGIRRTRTRGDPDSRFAGG